ncbi:MAG: leucyl/phenylalanyl-tRNA--protein transferase [Planctomycetes bacterium]|nr:leucyl/phenylalanyl-tRNA--protein transferase [Planctomycetota bacterium]
MKRVTAEDLVPIILDGYRHGAFPMGDPEDGSLGFYTCDPRAVMPLEAGALRFSDSLRRRVRSGRFRITVDTHFRNVIECCARDRSAENRCWITPLLQKAYELLHREGYAHSVEASRDGKLVGGLYGVAIGGAFFGESMFSLPHEGGTDASKVCLVHLVERLRARGFILLDCQYANAHTRSLGAVEMPVETYTGVLERAVQMSVAF